MPVRKMRQKLMQYFEMAGAATTIAQLEDMTEDEIRQLCEDTFGQEETDKIIQDSKNN